MEVTITGRRPTAGWRITVRLYLTLRRTGWRPSSQLTRARRDISLTSSSSGEASGPLSLVEVSQGFALIG